MFPVVQEAADDIAAVTLIDGRIFDRFRKWKENLYCELRRWEIAGLR